MECCVRCRILELLELSIMARYVMTKPLYGGDSQTIPDEALTVREIIDKFTRGLPCPVFHESNDDDQDLSEEEQMSLQDFEDDWQKRQLLIDFEEQNALAAGGEPAAANEVKASGQGDQGEPEASLKPEPIETSDSQ